MPECAFGEFTQSLKALHDPLFLYSSETQTYHKHPLAFRNRLHMPLLVTRSRPFSCSHNTRERSRLSRRLFLSSAPIFSLSVFCFSIFASPFPPFRLSFSSLVSPLASPPFHPYFVPPLVHSLAVQDSGVLPWNFIRTSIATIIDSIG